MPNEAARAPFTPWAPARAPEQWHRPSILVKGIEEKEGERERGTIGNVCLQVCLLQLSHPLPL